MMFHNLSRHANPWTLMTYTAAGTGDTQTSSVVDTFVDAACMFLITLGTVSTNGAGLIKVQMSADNNVTDPFTDVAGSGIPWAVGNTLQTAVIDIYRPWKRYLQVVLLRTGGGNTVISAVTALTYHLGVAPGDSEPIPTATARNIINVNWLNSPGPGAA
jgi:hypothetical protein